jgi:hypothetical protein
MENLEVDRHGTLNFFGEVVKIFDDDELCESRFFERSNDIVSIVRVDLKFRDSITLLVSRFVAPVAAPPALAMNGRLPSADKLIFNFAPPVTVLDCETSEGILAFFRIDSLSLALLSQLRAKMRYFSG